MNRFDAQPQTRKACQAILRHIRRMRLDVGDRLPPQDVLSRELGVCFNTLVSAMKALVAAGHVERKTRTGTVVKSLSPPKSNLCIWRVGLCVLHEGEGEFILMLQHHLRRHLHAAGCFCQTYFIDDATPTADIMERSPSEFAGLEDDLDDGFLDAIVTPTRLWTERVPVCAIPGHDRARSGFILDQEQWIHEAVERLLRAGARSIALVHASPPPNDYAAPWLAYESSMGRRGLATEFITGLIGFDGGIRVCDELLARPAVSRPDALIVSNDHVAHGIACRLRLGSGEYRPLVAAQTNRQAPLNFPYTVMKFELDIESLARRGVAYALDCMLEPEAGRKVYRFNLDSPQVKGVGGTGGV